MAMLKKQVKRLCCGKWHMLCLTIVLLLLICGCSTTDETAVIEATEKPVPILDSIDYWGIVHDEIVSMLNRHNLYVSFAYSTYPCKFYEVKPGRETDDGKITAVGLSQTEYEELYQCIKEELHTILDKYELAKPKTIFHACYSDIGISFYNWFLDENTVNDRGIYWQVASYQIDLLKYYHEDKVGAYTCWGGFSDQRWSEYEVYMP